MTENRAIRKRGRPKKGEEQSSPKKPGRPRKQSEPVPSPKRKPGQDVVITEEMLRQAEELAGYGLSSTQIAAVLGLPESTFYAQKASSAAFSGALERGKAKAAGIVGKALFLRAKDGDVAAIRWWEMTRQGRSERQQTEAKVEVLSDPVADARLARIIEETATRLENGSHPPMLPGADG